LLGQGLANKEIAERPHRNDDPSARSARRMM
jgi:hypothetical protein